MSDLRQSHHEHDTLSPGGRARREAMLGELVHTMQHLRRRRQRGRAAISAAVVVGLVAAGWWVTGRTEEMPRARTITVDTPGPARGPIRVRIIDDEELLALLAEIGRPAGLVRSGGRAWLTSDVTDAALEGAEAPPTL